MRGDPKIAIVIPYFGRWEPWTPLFFETARRNDSVAFLVFTDCDPTHLESKNVTFFQMPFQAYIQKIQAVFPNFSPSNPYKLCDFRPLLGRIHEREFHGYDFWGWCDIDVLLGDIRAFYSREVLSRFDVLSTHDHRISGHLALFRNSSRNRWMYRRIYDWRGALRNPEFVGIDEHGLTNAFLMTLFDKVNEKFGWHLDNPVSRFLSRWRRRRMYMREQYTTPFLPRPWLDGTLNSQQPSRWTWRDGVVTNTRDGDRRFLYLHLMNFKSSRWRHDGTRAPWEGRTDICKANVADMQYGISIDERGILPLDPGSQARP